MSGEIETNIVQSRHFVQDGGMFVYTTGRETPMIFWYSSRA